MHHTVITLIKNMSEVYPTAVGFALSRRKLTPIFEPSVAIDLQNKGRVLVSPQGNRIRAFIASGKNEIAFSSENLLNEDAQILYV